MVRPRAADQAAVARLLDLAEAPLRALMTLERTYRAEYGTGVPPLKRGAIPAPIGHPANA